MTTNKVYGYGFGGDYPTGLPFVILEYVEGRRLFDLRYHELDPRHKATVDRQVANIIIQLRQQEFGHIGALTLDDDGAPAFQRNRPLSIDLNEDQIDGQDPARLLAPDAIFTSTEAYVQHLLELAYHTFLRQRDAVGDEENARYQLFTLHYMRDKVRAWLDRRYDKGPFVLMHGDLSPANIIVDDDFRILAVLDWEWSQTIPLQLVVPPNWLTGLPLEQVVHRDHSPAITEAWARLADCVREEERSHHVLAKPQVSELWTGLNAARFDSIFIGSALLNLSNLHSVFYSRFFSRDADRLQRFERFFSPAWNPAAEDHRRLVVKKLDERKKIRALIDDRDVWFDLLRRPRSPVPAMDEEEARRLRIFVRGFSPGHWARVCSLYHTSLGMLLSSLHGHTQLYVLSTPRVDTTLNLRD
ncbi:MAG: hypothetical protein M1832_000355 [Thelocarpon impressellum]|nr:MAG: hypothetical protein M1832_000355 [Thelocarpon impressellum]